jgi:hypothetical protein
MLFIIEFPVTVFMKTSLFLIYRHVGLYTGSNFSGDLAVFIFSVTQNGAKSYPKLLCLSHSIWRHRLETGIFRYTVFDLERSVDIFKNIDHVHIT